MPTFLKTILSFCAKVLLIVIGGVVGIWLFARDLPVDGGGLGDGIGMLLFGAIGMIIAGMVGIVGLVIFWSVLAARNEAAGQKTNDTNSAIAQAEGVWPPPPKH